MNWIKEYISKNPSPSELKLPLRFESADLSGIPEGKLQHCAKAYLENFWEAGNKGIGCLFLGKAGTYKTYTACAIAKRIRTLANLETMFVQCPIFVSQIERNRFSSKSEDMIKQVSRTPFVVMDDFSQIQPNSFGANLLLEVAEARFSNLRPTIWTGNIAIPVAKYNEIVKVITGIYGPSFGRRIVEASKGYGVVVE